MGLKHSSAAITDTQSMPLPQMSAENTGNTTLTGVDRYRATVREYLSTAGLSGEVFGEADDAEGVAQAWFLQETGDQQTANLLANALVKTQGIDFVFAEMPEGRIFMLEKLAGQGAQGVLYRVLDTRNRANDVLAAKVLPVEGEDEQAQHQALMRLVREGKILETLTPTRVAPAARGMGKRSNDGKEEHYQLMEFVEGFRMDDLGHALAHVRQNSRGRTKIGAERAVARVLGQMLHTESTLGEKGITHRDIKPANMILKTEGEERGMLALIDFGLAVAAEGQPGQTRVTRTGVIAGTPAYMAPNAMEHGVRKGGSVLEADLFSIGATAHEYLSGKSPIQEATLKSIFLHVAEWDGELPHLEDIEDRALRDVLRALLHKDETERGDPLSHLLALRKAGLVHWSKKQILGSKPLAMHMPEAAGSSLDATALAEFWAQKYTPPVISRRAFIGSAATATLLALEAKMGVVRNKIAPPIDERPWKEAIVREPEKARSPYGVTYQSARTDTGAELRTGVQEIQLQLSAEEVVHIAGQIPGVRNEGGGLQAYIHSMSPDQIEHLRNTFRSQNTGAAVIPQCVTAFVAPDGALAMMIPHVGLVCQDAQGRIDYVWDVQWSIAMNNTTPPPREIEAFFALHFLGDFASGLSTGDSFEDLRDQIPDLKEWPSTMTAKDVASRNWDKIKRACKLGTNRVAQRAQ